MLKPSIPLIDLRGKTPVDLLRAYPDKAGALIAASRRTFGIWSRILSTVALPVGDFLSYRWLKRTRNPYLYEIESFADVVDMSGIYALNLSYEWGCTSGVFRTDDSVSLLRLLDWPFPALGEHVVVALQQGKVGGFYNITWPGMSGVITGMATGRFSAALNLAPMRQYKLGLAGDWLVNRLRAKKQIGLPPSHLLRKVFEQAENYEVAKQMLTNTPLAVPAIFILAGTRPGQGCVIERLEDKADISELSAGHALGAANHFSTTLSAIGKGWRARMGNSHERLRQCSHIHGHDLSAEHFDWVQPPMVNQFTRLAVVADAATGRLMVQGYEGITQVTELFDLPMHKEEREAM